MQENREEKDIKEMLQIVKQLDKKSLLLLKSGVELLAARQNMEDETSTLKVGK